MQGDINSPIALIILIIAFMEFLFINFRYISSMSNDYKFRNNQFKNAVIYRIYIIINHLALYKSVVVEYVVQQALTIIFIVSVVILGLLYNYRNNYFYLGEWMYSWRRNFVLFLIFMYIIWYLIFIPKREIKRRIYLNEIEKATKGISEGELDYQMKEYMGGILKKIAFNINNMREGYKKALDEQIKSERMKTELITNVSHDLKTPLTSIINYADLLQKQDISQEEKEGYVLILNKKAQRLKILIEDLFEVSKVNSGALEFNKEKIDIVALLKQTLAEWDERIKSSDIIFKTNISNEHIYSFLDGKRTWRVFDNLINNILKYSQSGTRAYIDLKQEKNKNIIEFKNIASYEMDFEAEEIIERFKRGDKSRNSEGNGLGLAIAKSIVEAQRGEFKICIDGHLFKVTIKLDIIN